MATRNQTSKVLNTLLVYSHRTFERQHMAAVASSVPCSLPHSLQELQDYPVFLNPKTFIPPKEDALQHSSASKYSQNLTESHFSCENKHKYLLKEANPSPENSANDCCSFLISSLKTPDTSTESWKHTAKTQYFVNDFFRPFNTHNVLSHKNRKGTSSSFHTPFGAASKGYCTDCTESIGSYFQQSFDRHFSKFSNSLHQNRQNRRFFFSGVHTLEKQTEDYLNSDSNPKSEIDKVTAKEPIVLYRGKWMRTFRLLVRLKVIQLVGVATLALPIAEYTQEGHLSIGTIVAVGGVVGGAVIASGALWYYSQRYIGELALLPPNFGKVQISVLDFWGNRQEIIIDRSSIVPPLKEMSKGELAMAAKQTLLPLDVIGLRQFVLSIRHGQLLQRSLLIGLLDGTLDAEPVSTDLNK